LSFNRLAEDGILPIEKRRIAKTDIELRTGGVGIRAARHRDGAGDMRDRTKFTVELVAGSAGSIAIRITTLNDEAGFDAMEGEPVIKARTRELDKRRTVLRRLIGIEVENDIALRGRDAHANGLSFGSELREVATGWFGIGRHAREILYRATASVCFPAFSAGTIAAQVMGRRMKTENAPLRLRVVPSARCVRRVRERIATFAIEHGLVDEGLRDLLTAVGEALANAIEHSRSMDAIDIECWISNENQFMANVTDHGVGFQTGTPRAARLPALSAERGRGLPLMRRCSDFFSISSEPHVGTTVTVGRTIRQGQARPRRAASR